ncbi:MAG: S8 family serine peptidase, partial [Bacteroidota bacterium]|nr:S8 family serine peptidase [Bacteroidota bacterium]
MESSATNDKATPSLPPLVFAHASVLSVGGVSLFDSTEHINFFTVQNYYSEDYMVQKAVYMLRAYGFFIMAVNGITISISAAAAVYEKAFVTKLRAEELPVLKGKGEEDTATFILPRDGNVPGTIDVRKTVFSSVLEGVSINEPVYFMSNFIAPKKEYWHLSVPGDVSVAINADKAHRIGITARGVKAVMVDTGWYRHPYFERRGYVANPVVLGPATNDPFNDTVGHGTGESANLFAVAPDVNFTMVKMNFVDNAGAFNTAVNLKPHIISCSWGNNKPTGPLTGNDKVLSAAIANAVSLGITVVFSAGNGHWGYPGQHPDVISAGGVYI